MKIQFTLTFFAFLFCIAPEAQTIQRIADINPGPGGSFFDDEIGPIEYKGTILFTANDGTHGHELWMYDGINASLVKDIYAGPKSSNPQSFFLMGDMVIFTAKDSLHGDEWWVTDGTAEGTQLIKDIFPGPENGTFVNTSIGQDYHALYNGEVYFTGGHRLNDYELWKTDGTAEGTVLVKNISPDNSSFNTPSYPKDYVEHKGILYLSSHDGLWKTDGTTAGTTLINDDLDPYDLISLEDYFLFLNSGDLWRSDGTTEGTIKIRDFGTTVLNWTGDRLTRLENFVLFPANDEIHGDELWRSDGTLEGTFMVIDLIPGEEGYAPQNTVVYKNQLYYKGDDGERGHEFWASDGTQAGTRLVKELDPGSDGGFYLPTIIYTDGNLIYISGGPGFQKELWVSDGTAAGTYEIDINPNGQSSPATFGKYGDKLFVYAYTQTYGSEPYLVEALPSAINEFTLLPQLKIYPNPTNGIINLECPEGMDLKHRLMDLQGNIISDNIPGNALDLNAFSSGTYFLISIDTIKGVGYYSKVVVVD